MCEYSTGISVEFAAVLNMILVLFTCEYSAGIPVEYAVVLFV